MKTGWTKTGWTKNGSTKIYTSCVALAQCILRLYSTILLISLANPTLFGESKKIYIKTNIFDHHFFSIHRQRSKIFLRSILTISKDTTKINILLILILYVYTLNAIDWNFPKFPVCTIIYQLEKKYVDISIYYLIW